MPANSSGQIAVWRDAVDVASFNLSLQDTGVRVRQAQSPSTTIALPGEQPNDGDTYEVIDADGSCSAAHAIVIVPPAGTTIRGAASFSLLVAYDCVCLTFDGETDDWTACATETPGAGGGNETIALPVGLVSVSSATILPAGALILRAYLEVTTPYSPGTTITLGQTGAPAEFMGAADSNPQAAAIYEVPQLTTAAGAHPLLVTVAGAPAAGAAVAVVEYAPSPSD